MLVFLLIIGTICAMDKFDFGAPVSATIIYDDSDDGTIDIKSSEENFVKEIKKPESEPSNVTQVQNVLEKTANTDLLTPSRNATGTKIFPTSKHILENDKCTKKSKSISKNKKKHKLQEKLMDMPSIEEENFDVDICNIDIAIRDKSKETYTTDQNGLEKQNKKENLITNKEFLKEKSIVSIFFSNTTCHTEKQNIKQKKEEAPTINEEIRTLSKELRNSGYETQIKSSIEGKQISKKRHSKEFRNADHKKRNTSTSTQSENISHRLTEELNNSNNEKQNKKMVTNEVGDILQIEPLTKKKQFSDIDHVENLKDVTPDIMSTINSSVEHQKSFDKLTCALWLGNVNRSEIHEYNNADLILADNKTTQGSLNDDNELRQTFRCDKYNCNNFICCNKTPESTEISLLEKQKNNVEIENSYFINSTAITSNQQQYVNGSNDTLYKPQNDINNLSIFNYFKELLSTVSEHMIYVMKSYQFYHRVHKNNNVDQRLLEKAKNDFLRTRNHFFDLSYSSVLNIILPRYNDVTFVKIFLTNTVEIARSKFNNYSYEHMQSLLLDMVTWVRKRQEQIQNMNVSSTVNSLLAQELQKPLRYPNKYQGLKSHKIGPTPRWNPIQFGVSNGNAQKSLHKANMQRPSNGELLQSQISQRISPPHRQRKKMETNSVLHGYSFESSGINEQNVNIQLPNFIQQNMHPRQDTKEQTHNSIQQLNSVVNYIQPHPNHYNNTNVQSTTQQRELFPKQSEQQLALPGWQSDINHTFTQDFQLKNQEMTSVQNVLQFQHYNPMQADLNRSSISRDSGFMSPQNFNTSSDLTVSIASKISLNVNLLSKLIIQHGEV